MKTSNQLTWYSNELGYTHTLVSHVAMVGRAVNGGQ